MRVDDGGRGGEDGQTLVKVKPGIYTTKFVLYTVMRVISQRFLGGCLRSQFQVLGGNLTPTANLLLAIINFLLLAVDLLAICPDQKLRSPLPKTCHLPTLAPGSSGNDRVR